MAAIASIAVSKIAAFAAAISTLSADDTITYDEKKRQLLLFTNTTGGSLTANVKGSTASTKQVDGVGSVSLTAGKDVVVGAGLSVGILLSSIAEYLPGIVHITGAANMKVQLFEF